VEISRLSCLLKDALTTAIAAPEALGRWLESSLLRTPRGKLTWKAPSKLGLPTHVALAGGRSVGAVKGSPYHSQWIATLPGWLWRVPNDGSVAARIGAEESPARAFPTLRAAKRACADALSLLPPINGIPAAVAAQLTEADLYAIAQMPVGWFEATSLPHTVKRPEYRCDRLTNLGVLERRVRSRPASGWEFRRPDGS
jgi:hypothetical protein